METRLGIGKLARGSVNQYAKLCGDNVPEGLKKLQGQENKALAEEYVWGREFVDLVKEFPGVVTEPQSLFNVLQRLTPRMYSITLPIERSPIQAHPATAIRQPPQPLLLGAPLLPALPLISPSQAPVVICARRLGLPSHP